MVGLLLCVVESCVLGLAVAPKRLGSNQKKGGRDNETQRPGL